MGPNPDTLGNLKQLANGCLFTQISSLKYDKKRIWPIPVYVWSIDLANSDEPSAVMCYIHKTFVQSHPAKYQIHAKQLVSRTSKGGRNIYVWNHGLEHQI